MTRAFGVDVCTWPWSTCRIHLRFKDGHCAPHWERSALTVTALGRNARVFGGESIVIDRADDDGHKRFVVDLGGATSGLHVRAVQACPDVVVLTHDDTDHIGGAATALSSLGDQCMHRGREVWLPADWLLALLAFAAATRQDLGADWGDGAVSPEDLDGPDDALLTAPRPAPEVDTGAREQPRRFPRVDNEERDHLDGVLDAVEAATQSPHRDDPAVRVGVIGAVEQIRRRGDPTEIVGTPDQIADRALRSIVRILRVVRAARECSRVRWFSPDLAPAASGPAPHSEIRIVNAGEVLGSWRPRITSAYAVFLQMVTVVTVQNRRALVTFIEPTSEDDRNGVLVWSDSTGTGRANAKTAPWGRTGLMTAPHHGSA